MKLLAPRYLLAAILVFAGAGYAGEIRTPDGLAARVNGLRLDAIALDARPLPDARVEIEVQHPRTHKPIERAFAVNADWQAASDYLRLQGEVLAEGRGDVAADLVVRVKGAKLALSTMSEAPLLQPQRLLSKLPLVSLRLGGEDHLALAVPATKLAIFDFRQRGDAVELRYRFGFTADAKPHLNMRAPFACILYRTDPAWHFRSALARYYAFFPKPFEPFARKQGGWFFAAATKDLPNPQHFAYHEGGPWGWEADHARGMGTYPYRESSSYTISLSGDQLPKSYDEAMKRFAALEQKVALAVWTPSNSYAVAPRVRHSGERSLLADSGDTGAWTGGRQAIMLDPAVSAPILVKAFSRAEGVSGAPDDGYSIYVDVCCTDGSYLFGQCATFPTGTHDWVESSKIIKPIRPVGELRVYCLLRGHRGKAWFDDVHVGPLDKPDVNWLQNPGFEQDRRDRRMPYVRDNVCHNSRGEYVVRITDNASADVPPAHPLNLLRFTLNVDPDVPSTPKRPAVAATQFADYDKYMEQFPKIDGCYIDSVSSWCARVLNFRREHWRYNDFPFTYDPQTWQVAPHGRFAMFEFLRALQQRYHPLGKAIFTNIHVSLDSFPLYLVSDVPGIESSRFSDEDSMFFYRACSCRKPLLLLNFMNLHGLDNRRTAEQYHLNAGQWGEFPSTGRFVQRAYREYGDVTHAYMPATKELSAAGWRPIPLAHGARVERFADRDAVFFTVRAPEEPCEQTLVIDPQALAKLGHDLVAFDAVWLAELPLEKRADRWAIPFVHGDEMLHIVRVSARPQVVPWLVSRARGHAANAARVRGKQSETPARSALIDALAQPPAQATRECLDQLAGARTKLDAALQALGAPGDDLFALSERRELLQARQALAAAVAFAMDVRPTIMGTRMGYPGQALTFSVRACEAAPRACLSAAPGRCIVPTLEPSPNVRSAAGLSVSVGRAAPDTMHVRAVFELRPPRQGPLLIERLTHAFVVPAAKLRLTEAGSTSEARRYTVAVERRQPNIALSLRVLVEPRAAPRPQSISLGSSQAEAAFEVDRVLDGTPRTLTVIAYDRDNNEAARAETRFWDEPRPASSDLALASRGASASTESNYPGGYNPAPLIDGITARSNLHWTQHAWASRDNSQSHWVQIDLPKPTSVREVWIYWAIDSRRTHTSRHYTIVGLTRDGPRELLKVKDQSVRTVSLHTIAPTSVRAIRIEQPAQGGVAERPGIMWVREVCLIP